MMLKFRKVCEILNRHLFASTFSLVMASFIGGAITGYNQATIVIVATGLLLFFLYASSVNFLIVVSLSTSFALTLFLQTIWAQEVNYFRFMGVNWAIFGGVPLLFLLLVKSGMKGSRSVVIRNGWWYVLYAIPLWALAMSLFGLDSWRAIRYALWMLLTFMAIIEMVHVVGPWPLFVWSLWIFATVSGFFLVVSLFTNSVIGIKDYGYSGVFGAYVRLGMPCIFASTSGLALLYLGSTGQQWVWVRTVFLIALVVMATMVGFFTLSRATWISIGLGFLLYAWFTRSRLTPSALLRFGVIGIAVILALNYSFGESNIDLASLATPRIELLQRQLRGEASGRFDVWIPLWEFVIRHPLQGAGLTGANDAVGLSSIGWLLGTSTGAHNFLLGTLVEQGFPGLILLCAVMLKAVSITRYFENDIRGAWWLVLLPNLAAMIVYSGTSLPTSPFYWVFWICLIVAMGAMGQLSDN